MIEKISPVNGEVAHLKQDGISRPIKDTKARNAINALIDNLTGDFATKEWVKSSEGAQTANYDKTYATESYAKDTVATYEAGHYVKTSANTYKSAEGMSPELYPDTYTLITGSEVRTITIKAGLDELDIADKYLRQSINKNTEDVNKAKVDIARNEANISVLNGNVSKVGSVLNSIYNNAKNAHYDEEYSIKTKIQNIESQLQSTNRGQFRKVDSIDDIPLNITGLGYIWLVPDAKEGYKEYCVITDGSPIDAIYELSEFGNTKIDLAEYAKQSWVLDNAAQGTYKTVDGVKQSIANKLDEIDVTNATQDDRLDSHDTAITNISSHLDTVDNELEVHDYKISKITSAPVDVIKTVSKRMGTISVPKLELNASHLTETAPEDPTVSYLVLSSYDQETETLTLNNVRVKSTEEDVTTVVDVDSTTATVYGVPATNVGENEGE